MKITNNKINLFSVILLFISFVYLFNIFIFHFNFNELIGIKGLLINYDGGFIRRGLLGEIKYSSYLLHYTYCYFEQADESNMFLGTKNNDTGPASPE